MNTPRPINVYAELTPNPNSIKFVADVMLLEGGVVEYMNKAEAVNCPLAFQLFDFSGIDKVFITANFITITKVGDIDWFEITNIIREFVRGFLMSGEALFIGSPFDINHIPGKKNDNPEIDANKTIKVAEIKKDIAPLEDIVFDPGIDKKIMDLLDEYVRPAVEGDGGAIHFKSYVNGTVNVVLKGACSGCPSSTVTLKSGIENMLKQMLPGNIREVVAISE